MSATTLDAPALTVAAKLTALRSHLAAHTLDYYLVLSADEHLNEYLPEAKQRRQWVTGFTGSAGDFLLGREQAWLFVDSRYHEQADQEIDAALMQVVKLGLTDQKSLTATLADLGRSAQEKGASLRVGYDPFTLPVVQFEALQQKLEPWAVTLVPLPTNLVDQVRLASPWHEAAPLPPLGTSTLFALPTTQTGASLTDKLAQIREAMQAANVQLLPITKLDQIAWLTNLRGWDIPYNPVFIAYGLVSPDRAWLFTNRDRIPRDLRTELEQELTLLPYDHYATTLPAIAAELQPCRVLVDPKHTTVGTLHLLADCPGCTVTQTDTPISQKKACKNDTEIAQMQQANLKASRAKIRTLHWLAAQMAAQKTVTEQAIAHAIEQFYAEEPDFQGLSFNTIAAGGANSSIVHYSTPNAQPIAPGSFVLLDSGAQYAAGTTDDTRTVVWGEPTPAQIARYTAVLQAHIDCAMQQFPKGTTGAQLDGITRAHLWQQRLDFGHGTGHGVGAFLNVHEGPNGISKRVSHPLEPGMVTSIEPGFYVPEWGGIRLENLYVVRELPPADDATEDEAATPWYGFEPLTYIPFERALIDWAQLSDRQRQWLQHYYQMILDKLRPTLAAPAATWLQAACTLN